MAFTEQSKGGKKGKAGRKSAPVEFAKAQAIIKAWTKVAAELEKQDVSVKDIALPMVLKDMVAKVGNPDGSNMKFVSIYAGKSFQGHPSDSQDIQPEEENKSGSGRNECEQDNIDSDLAD